MGRHCCPAGPATLAGPCSLDLYTHSATALALPCRTLTVTGAIKAPHIDEGFTDLSKLAEIRNAPAPWGEAAGAENGAIVPSGCPTPPALPCTQWLAALQRLPCGGCPAVQLAPFL